MNNDSPLDPGGLPVRQPTGGGQANASGVDFQNRAAAWMAVRILAGTAASPLWGLPADATLEFIRCETEQPVDDILLGTSHGGFVFIQAKHSLDLSRQQTSELAGALNQFVRQFLAHSEVSKGQSRWERPLDPSLDRLVLVVGPGSSAPVREQVRSVLDRARRFVPGQVIANMATNVAEVRAWEIIREHVSRSWEALTGVTPADDQLLAFSRLLEITTLDVGEGGAVELAAKDILRAEILKNPEDADVAWTFLIQASAQMAAARGGADRRALQADLARAGIGIRATRSYRDDIQRMQSYTRANLALVRRFASTRVGDAEVRIDRPSTASLREMTETSSVVVVGQPGAGKSAAMHDLALMLLEGKLDVVFLTADGVASQSIASFADEIHLDHPLAEVLENWPGDQPGYVLIDALDAARSETSAKTLRDLIAATLELGGRWRVVASIRKYDLRYDLELRDLFRGLPSPEYQDAEFARLRHLSVPVLEDAELVQVSAQSPELGALLRSSPPALLELLRVPFNLRIAAELIGGGTKVDELVPLETQVELLNRYWTYRVIGTDARRDARETVLRRAAEHMVEQRSLRAERKLVVEPTTSEALDDLLSKQVLVEWQLTPTIVDEDLLAFSHHVLFDYAVARLLLRQDPVTLGIWLAQQPDLALAIRPSIVFYFQRLWSRGDQRASFWSAVFALVRTPDLPEVGKLIGPTVAAELGQSVQDFERLLVDLDSTIPERIETANEVLRHLVGAIVTWRNTSVRPPVGPSAGPWAAVIERASRSSHESVQYTIRVLIATVCEEPEALSPDQMGAYGLAARSLFRFAWTRSPRDGWLVISAIQAVCRSFPSDPAASADLIRRCLDADHLAQYGYEELPRLAHEVTRLIPHDLDLVESIYIAAFTYTEHSKATTPMGPSRILAMTSNRAQDYGMARYELADCYGAFLQHAPLHAARALIAALETYVQERQSPDGTTLTEYQFDFGGTAAWIRQDYSFIWASGDLHAHDDPIRMLKDFGFYLNNLAQAVDRRPQLRDLVGAIVKGNRLAVLWKMLLSVGASHPTTLGQEILPMAWANPILALPDTTVAAGRFLSASFPALSVATRERIERAVMGISRRRRSGGDGEGEGELDGYETRNRLLGCLPQAHLVTEEAQLLRQRLQADGNIPPNAALFGGVESSWGPYTDEDSLREAGVPFEEQPNQRVFALMQPAKNFASSHQNSTPSMTDAQEIWPALEALRRALASADADGVHPTQKDRGWGHLAEAAECISRREDLSCQEHLGTWIRDILLQAATSTIPEHHPEDDEPFDSTPSWGAPAARIDAAAGLVSLARNPDCADMGVLGAIHLLCTDPVPAVRFQIARRLNALVLTAPEFMWQHIEEFAQHDPSPRSPECSGDRAS